jgi:NAD(P)-dependent dehydrogenase (short-subunit alcohol dehydrogenase family)
MGAFVVVGAGPGLGAAAARRFGREGHPVGLIARSAASLETIAAGLASEGITTATESADVTDEKALTAALGALRAARSDRNSAVQPTPEPRTMRGRLALSAVVMAAARGRKLGGRQAERHEAALAVARSLIGTDLDHPVGGAARHADRTP